MRYLILLCLIVRARSMEKTQMYMKRSEVNDQSMSGSGYSYNIHDGAPKKEFSFETDDDVKALNILKNLGYDPFAEVPRYATEHIPLPYEEYYKGYLDAGDENPLDFKVNQDSYHIPEAKVLSRLYSPLDQYEKITYPPKYYFPYAHGFGHDSHDAGQFLKEGGKSYNANENSKYGEKVDTGYKNIDAFDKALKGTYGKEDSQSYYNQNGGQKQSVFDNAGNYAVNDAAGKVSFGESFGQNKGHNKGSKTTGYHKVYHKDDYNKQHKFYDKADKRGHFNKYGDYNAKNGNDHGSFVNGGSANKGYDNKEYGTKGISDRGKIEDVNKNFKSADGNEGFYAGYSGFSKNGGKEGARVEGYSV